MPITKQACVYWIEPILRLPAFFLLETSLKTSDWVDVVLSVLEIVGLDKAGIDEALHTVGHVVDRDTVLDALVFLSLLLYISVPLISVCLLLLNLQQLVKLYTWFISSTILIGTYRYSGTALAALNGLEERGTSIYIQCCCLLMQIISSILICFFLNLPFWSVPLFLPTVIPICLFNLGFSKELQLTAHNAVAVHFIVFFVVMSLIQTPKVIAETWTALRVLLIAGRGLGLPMLLISLWRLLRLRQQFLLFWVILFSSYIIEGLLKDADISWLILGLTALGESVSTVLGICGLSVFVSAICSCFLWLISAFLEASLKPFPPPQDSGVCVILMMLLIQTELTEREPEERGMVVIVMMFIVSASLFQSVHDIADPFLLRLAAAHSMQKWRHIRAISLMLLLWIIPLLITWQLLIVWQLSLWVLIGLTSLLLVSVQAMSSLVVYGMFMYDHFKTNGWQSLDDAIFYVKSAVRIIEFLVAVTILSVGVYDVFTGDDVSGSWTIVLLGLHSYFVWHILERGWKEFMLRRSAVRKVQLLPLATSEELQQHNDVCSICYQTLNSARRTRCSHFFHEVCLRKWLYVQSFCPMCHESITDKADGDSTENSQENQANNQDDQPQNDAFRQVRPTEQRGTHSQTNNTDQGTTESLGRAGTMSSHLSTANSLTKRNSSSSSEETDTRDDLTSTKTVTSVSDTGYRLGSLTEVEQSETESVSASRSAAHLRDYSRLTTNS